MTTNLKKQLSEAAFEEHVANTLVELHGYFLRASGDYDRMHAMDTELLMQFLGATQVEKLAKLEERHGERYQEKLLARIDEEIGKRGILDVLRKGVDHTSEHFELMYFLPVSHLNPDAAQQFQINIFSVMRQVYFSRDSEKSIDLGLFINGLPIATVELKNEITGQTVENAKRQYMTDRDAREKLLSFKRCLVHFAADTSQVFLATHLANEKTFFLPFNKGVDGGAGNPAVENKHKTHYLWEDAWSKESWSDLIGSFITIIEEEKSDGSIEEVQIFPRYHQRDAVLRLRDAVLRSDHKKNYLIQHSAGSGKSMTIAWTAYRLAQLHTASGEKVFDSVFVVTDRRALDKQLRKTVKTFEPVSGFLASVREDHGAKTGQLMEAIENGAKVITTTIQVFPYVTDVIGNFPGKKFAILVDEAHSSQGGETSRALHETLHGDDSDKDFILHQLASRQQGESISYFAFTATPKQETLEKFGYETSEGFVPFSLYSMQQAIEEGFILDVLQNYTTLRQFFKILKKIEENPSLPKARALSAIRRYIRNHPETIAQKVEIIVQHFDSVVAPLLNGQAKVMIVTNSRESAVKYKLAIDVYLREHGFSYKSLVAFSDDIEIDGISYTETSINGVNESQTIEEFKKSEYKFLIVANKHQTGFDEPLLCGMYVDKRLSGVNAVQTLSRLNRMKKGKENVYVLDFSNTTQEIKEAFDNYYTTTILSEGLDENIINDTVTEINALYKIADQDLEDFILVLQTAKQADVHQAVNNILDRIAEDVGRIENDEVIADYRSKISFYVKLYPYAESVFGYANVYHEKLYWTFKFLLKKLPRERRQPLEIVEYLDAENIRVVRKEIQKTINLEIGNADIANQPLIPNGLGDEGGEDALEEIIKKANEEWGVEFGKKQVETLNRMKDEFMHDEDLRTTVEVNQNRENVVSVRFESDFDKKVNEQYASDNLLWTAIQGNPELKSFVREKMLKALFSDVKSRSLQA